MVCLVLMLVIQAGCVPPLVLLCLVCLHLHPQVVAQVPAVASVITSIYLHFITSRTNMHTVSTPSPGLAFTLIKE